MVVPDKQAPLADWLNRLEQLHPSEIELGLDRLRRVAGQLWDTPVARGVRVVTVAGTNGKGSCIETLQRLLIAQGRRTASYSSPHLVRFNERIRVDARPLEDRPLVRAMACVEQARQRADCPLTFFEFTTLTALQCFRELELDYLLLEVGLGGRLDAVNLVDPDLAVITAIGLDHCDWLGNDRESIALEKAGILRPGITAVIADPDPPGTLLQQVSRLGVCADYIDTDFGWRGAGNWFGNNRQRHRVERAGLPEPALPEGSVAAALQVLLLEGLLAQTEELIPVLSSLMLAGRCQRLQWQQRDLLLDVAHNRQAVDALADRLGRLGWDAGELLIVVGLLQDKPIDDTIAPLLGLNACWFAVDSHGARGQSADALAAGLAALGCSVKAAGPPMAGLQAAVQASAAGGRILVFGSFSVVGSVLNEELNGIRE